MRGSTVSVVGWRANHAASAACLVCSQNDNPLAFFQCDLEHAYEVFGSASLAKGIQPDT